MRKVLWLVFFLSFFIPPGAIAQTQDIHALRIVTQSFEKAKIDNKTRQDTIVSRKTHLIENLDTEGKLKSKEKKATFKVYTKKDGTPVEELVDIWPPKVKPAPNPVDLDKLLDAFLSRFYFLLNQDEEVVDGRKCYKIHFWPKEDLPSEKHYSDYILNRIAGLIYVDKKTYMVTEIDASLSRNVDKSKTFKSFFADRFDLKVKFQEWRRLGLPQTVTATARYSYRVIFFITRRFQTHTINYEYDFEQ